MLTGPDTQGGGEESYRNLLLTNLLVCKLYWTAKVKLK